MVAEAFERQGKLADALAFWQQAIVIDQTNPTPRLRGIAYQARELLERGKRSPR
jgi:hypothetical protein